MRSISLWLCVLASLVVASQAFQLPNIEEPEEDVLDELADDEDIDIARMLGDLFEDEEVDEDDDDEELTGRQLSTVTSSEQERYNIFMDTLLAQLQRQVKRDLEPLKVTLTPAKKNTKNEKKNDRKKTRKNAKRDEKDQKNKNRKINRDPKDISLPEIEDVEEEIHQVQRREAEAEEEFSGRRNNNDKNKEKKDKDDKNKNKNNRKNNNKKNNKNKKQNKNNKRQARSNKVVLHGLSNIAREGDVNLYNMKNGRALVTDFSIGPVELDITRNFGSDKDAEERKASASANKLNGKLMIKINKEGKPRIKKLKLNRPKDITMSGSVARSHDDKSVGFFKKSVKQVAPTAAKKLLKAAKAIIKTV